MQHSDFLIQMHRLETRWPTKYLDTDFTDKLFDICKELDILWLQKVVTEGVGAHRPPLLPEFRDAARIEKERLRPRPQGYNLGPSIFTTEQKTFMFLVARRAAAGSIPNQKEFVAHFTKDLEHLVSTGNKGDEAKFVFAAARKHLGM